MGSQVNEAKKHNVACIPRGVSFGSSTNERKKYTTPEN